MSAIVTGEAVVLELRPASFAARSLGAAIDLLLGIAVIIGLLAGFAALPQVVDPAAGRIIVIVGLVGVLVVLPVTVETLSRGKSLGKLAMGLRVVRDDGGAVRFRQALVRGLVGFFEIYLMLGSVAFLAALFNDKSKRLGDMLAGTYAIRDRAPKTPPLLVATPPYLAPWAAVADIGRLPDPLARRIGAFLRQSRQMAPASRLGLAQSLAHEASGHVAPLPAPGTPAEDFLAALMAERRERDFVRMSAAQERAEALGRRLRGEA
ncbi:RDD family protein [Specibacter cremeus]|uniref:RDD family protein n=1 Tax=Specibacter cremeus TaxID=1629051 RepID=UPI000F776837|nr:RDD family protein [Specibacter cremeus]